MLVLIVINVSLSGYLFRRKLIGAIRLSSFVDRLETTKSLLGNLWLIQIETVMWLSLLWLEALEWAIYALIVLGVLKGFLIIRIRKSYLNTLGSLLISLLFVPFVLFASASLVGQ